MWGTRALTSRPLQLCGMSSRLAHPVRLLSLVLPSPSVLPALLQVAAAWLLWSSSFLLLTFRCSHSLPLFQFPDPSSLSASCGGGSWKFLPVACRSRAWWSLAPGLKVDSLYKTDWKPAHRWRPRASQICQLSAPSVQELCLEPKLTATGHYRGISTGVF